MLTTPAYDYRRPWPTLTRDHVWGFFMVNGYEISQLHKMASETGKVNETR